MLNHLLSQMMDNDMPSDYESLEELGRNADLHISK